MILKPKVPAWNKSSNDTTTNKDENNKGKPQLKNCIIRHKNGFFYTLLSNAVTQRQ